MKTLIIKWLGLDTLAETVADMASYTSQLPPADEINNLIKRTEKLEEKVEEIEIPDMDDYMRECDLDSYLCDNEYVSSSYVDDEIESKVSEKVEEAINDIDIENKVKEVVDDMDKASFGDTEELKQIVRKVLEEMVKALADKAK